MNQQYFKTMFFWKFHQNLINKLVNKLRIKSNNLNTRSTLRKFSLLIHI